jgi:RNA polymerase sigma factor (sigma-70 family)
MADDDLAEFCGAEWPRLVGALSLYTGRRDLAEDLAQDALVRVCERWSTVRTADSPSAWAHRVAFNLAKSHFRRAAVWRRVQVRATERAQVVNVNNAAPIATRDALQSLPPNQREALVLRYYADLSVRDVAALMRCPENTVKTHTRRALAALRESGLLDDDDEEDVVGVIDESVVVVTTTMKIAEEFG